MERFRQGYLKHMNAFLASHSNVVSAMITGPANFPTARNQKRGQWADHRMSELYEWRGKATESIKRKLLERRPAEEKSNDEWAAINRDISMRLGWIKEDGSRPSSVNSIAGKVERLALNGQVELVEKSLELVRQFNVENPRPAITSRHKFWTFGDLARKYAAHLEQAASSESQTLAKSEGVEIILNPQADRVQIVFAARPSIEMIGKLKAEAWKWSPREGAWQRKLTEAAKWSAKRIIGVE